MSLLAQTPGQAPAVDPPAATAGAPECLASLKVPELRDRCKALNLPSSGVKAVLLERLGSEAGTPAKKPPDQTTPIPQTDGMSDPKEPASVQCVSLYPFKTKVPGDLNFEAGVRITVTRKDGDWWTGRLPDGSTGVFSSNYVELVPHEGMG
jgi:hypothetical protein